MPRPASPIFKSLWENFSRVSSELFIVKRLVATTALFSAPKWKAKAASIDEKIQGPMWVSPLAKFYAVPVDGWRISFSIRQFHQEWRRDWPDDATATGSAKAGRPGANSRSGIAG
jgi:hypothetical protein